MMPTSSRSPSGSSSSTRSARRGRNRTRRRTSRARGRRPSEVAGTLFKDPACAKDKDWLVDVAWRFHGTDAFTPLDHRWITSVDDDRRVQVDFTGAAIATGADAGRKVDIKVTYRCLTGASNGSSWYNVVCLATKEGDGTARSAADLTKTVTHEIGHFLNMVPLEQTFLGIAVQIAARSSQGDLTSLRLHGVYRGSIDDARSVGAIPLQRPSSSP